MKKFVFLSMVVIMVLNLIPNICLAEPYIAEASNIKLVVDGTRCDLENVPISINDRTLLPFREVAGLIGIVNDSEHIIWNEADQSIRLVGDEKSILLKINDTTAYAGGAAFSLDAAPVLYHDTTYVPVRFIAEGLYKKVIWDDITNTIVICDPKQYETNKEIITKALENLKAEKKMAVEGSYTMNDFYPLDEPRTDEFKDFPGVTQYKITWDRENASVPVVWGETAKGYDVEIWKTKPVSSNRIQEVYSWLTNYRDYVYGALKMSESNDDYTLNGDAILIDFPNHTEHVYYGNCTIRINKTTNQMKDVFTRGSAPFEDSIDNYGANASLNFYYQNADENSKLKYGYLFDNTDVQILKDFQKDDKNTDVYAILVGGCLSSNMVMTVNDEKASISFTLKNGRQIKSDLDPTDMNDFRSFIQDQKVDELTLPDKEATDGTGYLYLHFTKNDQIEVYINRSDVAKTDSIYYQILSKFASLEAKYLNKKS